MGSVVFVLLALITYSASQSVGPTIPLYNAANKGLIFPAIGLGTGYYGKEVVPYGAYPECGDEVHPPGFPPGPPAPGCGKNVQQSVTTWLKVGGIRVDTANSYFNLPSVERGIKESGLKREDIFIMSKVGPSYPLGYNDTISQAKEILQKLKTDYLDLLLVHWPVADPNQGAGPQSTDPLCLHNTSTYDEVGCRLSTWKAMVLLWQSGLVRSIGVSNYNETHITELEKENLPLPTVNQISFHPYITTGRQKIVEFCQARKILPVAYSPLGVPDWHPYPTHTGMSATVLQDPAIIVIASKYSKTPAQVVLRWELQWGVPPNPRSMNSTHMKDNLNVFDFELSSDDLTVLNSLAQDTCEVDGTWYECLGDGRLP